MDKDSLNRSYVPALVVGIIGLALLVFGTGCSGGGKIKTPRADITPPMSLLGKLAVDYYKAEVKPDGTASVEMSGFKTRNPDPELTKAAGKAITTIQAAKVATNLANQAAQTTRHIDDNAVRINDSNNALQATKVTAPLNAETEQAKIAADAANQ